MEISTYCGYIVIINCVLLVPGLSAKPFSINEALAIEEAKFTSHANTEITTKSSLTKKSIRKKYKYFEETSDYKPLGITHKPTILKYKNNKNFKKATAFLTPKTKELISALKHRKRIQIKTPSKLRLKKPRLNRRNQSVKRETLKYGKINEKYIPLLSRLNFLFDNVLNSGPEDSYENENRKFGRSQYNTRKKPESDDIVCTCAARSESKPQKETTTSATAIATEVSFDEQDQAEAASETTHYTAPSNLRTFRQNKNLPVLFARNTPRSQRNHHGLGKGSGATFHRSIQRNITRHNGDSEYHTRRERNDTHAADDEEDTNNSTRNGASSGGLGRKFERRGRNTRISNKQVGENAIAQGTTNEGAVNEARTDFEEFKIEDTLEHRNRIDATETNFESEVTTETSRSNVNELEVANKLKAGGNKTKHSQFFKDQRLRGRPSATSEVSDSNKSIQPEDDHAKSVVGITEHLTGHQRLPQGGSIFSTENKEIRTTDEAIIAIENLKQPVVQDKNAKVVVIIDGYSRTTRSLVGDHRNTHFQRK